MISVKNKFKKVSGLLAIAAIVSFSSNDVSAQNGEALFKQSCAACHSIGKGRLVGPDLVGISNKRSEAWLLKFIKSSQSLIKSGDADAKAIFAEYSSIPMPDQNLSPVEIKAVLAYIADKSPAEAPVVQVEVVADLPKAPEVTSADASKEDIDTGLALFTGKIRFENKGASCTSCHGVDYDGVLGGKLAKDLSSSHGNMGDAGIKGILSSPPFPAMTAAYKNSPLTDKEVFQLTAFLSHVNKEKIYQHHSKYEGYFIYGGGFGVLCLMSIIFFAFLNRKKYGVKHKIFERQTKSV